MILVMLSVGIIGVFAQNINAVELNQNPERNYISVTAINGKYGLKYKTGKIVIKPQYDFADTFSRNKAL